jgi:hypothetical protein
LSAAKALGVAAAGAKCRFALHWPLLACPEGCGFQKNLDVNHLVQISAEDESVIADLNTLLGSRKAQRFVQDCKNSRLVVINTKTAEGRHGPELSLVQVCGPGHGNVEACLYLPQTRFGKRNSREKKHKSQCLP